MKSKFLTEDNGNPSSARLALMITVLSACFIAIFAVVKVTMLLGQTVKVGGQDVMAFDANATSLIFNVSGLVLTMLVTAFGGKVLQKGKEQVIAQATEQVEKTE